jgi:hypothetical protein
MQADDFRRMALALTVMESAHMGHPDFRVGSHFRDAHTGNRFGMVALHGQQREFIDGIPGCSRLRLRCGPGSGAGESIGETLTLAWQNAIRKNNERIAAQTFRRPTRN